MALTINDFKVYMPAKDFEKSKRFYNALGFTMSEGWGGTADFQLNGGSFRLQNYYVKDWAENFMVKIGVDDVEAWHKKAQEVANSGEFPNITVKPPEDVDGSPCGRPLRRATCVRAIADEINSPANAHAIRIQAASLPIVPLSLMSGAAGVTMSQRFRRQQCQRHPAGADLMRLSALTRASVAALAVAELVGGSLFPSVHGAIFPTNWSRSGTTHFHTDAAINTAGWTLRTQDNDENIGFKSATLPSFNIPPGGAFSIVMNGFGGGAGPNFVDASTLPPGSIITTAPHDLDAGTWAYAMALYDNAFPIPQLQAFFQIRRAGSSAAVGGPTPSAQVAVNAGLWTSASAYIEFQTQFAGYGAPGFPNAPPTGPGSYVGFVFPEPSGLGLMFFGAAVLAIRLRRVAV